MNKYIEKISNFIIAKILLLYNYLLTILKNTISFIKKHFDNFVNKASLQINNPNIGSFDKFCYGIIVFTYWLLIQIKKLLLNILSIIKVEYKIKKLKTYELIFGHKNFKLSTPKLFYNVLKDIPAKSHILDFGCGSGICYKNNEIIKLIHNSNLKITGIDIDKHVLLKFKKRIESNILDNKIKLLYGDIFTMELPKFDYVIFSESAPTMSKDFLKKVVTHIKNNLLTDNGKIIFINNLVENPQFITKFLKPKLKYLTTINFGRALNKQEFENIKNDINMNVKFEIIDSMQVSEIANFFYLGYLFKVLNKFGYKNYDVEQYKITFENN